MITINNSFHLEKHEFYAGVLTLLVPFATTLDEGQDSNNT